MDEPTPEQLDGLLALSDTDAHIARLRKRLDDLPEQQQLDQAKADQVALKQRIADLQIDRDQVQARLSKEDREVAILRERLEAEQQRMYGGGITNPKELKSMEAEIGAVQRRIDEHEDAELEAMEQDEELATAITDGEQQLADGEAAIAELRGARDEAAKEVLAKIAELEVQAESQREPLPSELLERYDGVRDGFAGMAVGRLDQDQCTACGIRLSYADVNGLVEGPPLTTCPSCQRLMVVS